MTKKEMQMTKKEAINFICTWLDILRDVHKGYIMNTFFDAVEVLIKEEGKLC